MRLEQEIYCFAPLHLFYISAFFRSKIYKHESGIPFPVVNCLCYRPYALLMHSSCALHMIILDFVFRQQITNIRHSLEKQRILFYLCFILVVQLHTGLSRVISARFTHTYIRLFFFLMRAKELLIYLKVVSIRKITCRASSYFVNKTLQKTIWQKRFFGLCCMIAQDLSFKAKVFLNFKMSNTECSVKPNATSAIFRNSMLLMYGIFIEAAFNVSSAIN